MEYQNSLNINLKFEDTDLELLPSTYSFSIEDSIYDTYTKGEFILKDSTGLLQEYLMTVEGAKYELTIGYEDSFIKVPFIAVDDTLEENLTVGLINGNVKIKLIHEFKSLQDIKSSYYKDKISNIVKKQAGSYPFTKFDIEATGNDYEWYQLLKGQVDFINENLLPFAFSNSANKSPFFYFIDNKNQYNFKSFYSMIKGQKPISLTLTQGNDLATSSSSIIGIKRLRKGMDITYDLRHRKIYSFNESNGNLVEAEDYLADYPLNNKSIPIVGDKNLVTSYFLQEDYNTDISTKENLQGLLNSSMRDSMTLDRFVITLPFNPDIIAGIPIELIIPTAEDSSSNDFNLTGIYLVEKSVTAWDGENNLATTYAIIGRKDTFLPSSLYSMKKRLINEK